MDTLLRILFALIMLIVGGAMAQWLYRPAETYPTCHYTPNHSCR
jgi:hypothetical protein